MSARSLYDQLLAATGKGTPNYSMYAPALMWLVSIAPHFIAILGLSGGRFTNKSPREFTASIEGKATKSKRDKAYLRAEAAQLNGFENIGWFAAAVVAGNVAKLPAEELNSLAGAYLVSRVLFNFLYIATTDEILSYLRTGAYLAGVGINATLFVRSARALQ